MGCATSVNDSHAEKDASQQKPAPTAKYAQPGEDAPAFARGVPPSSPDRKDAVGSPASPFGGSKTANYSTQQNRGEEEHSVDPTQPPLPQNDSDVTLDRKESISRLTEEPGEISASLRLKYRVVKARLTNGIDDDVDQFNDEIAESFPVMKDKDVRRIQRWREECAAVPESDLVPIPLDAFFFPPPTASIVFVTNTTTSVGGGGDGVTTTGTDSVGGAGNSVTDTTAILPSMTNMSSADTSLYVRRHTQPNTPHGHNSGHSFNQASPNTANPATAPASFDAIAMASTDGNNASITVLPHQVPSWSPTANGKGLPLGSPNARKAGDQPLQLAEGETGLVEFLEGERHSPSSSRNASRNASRNVHVDEARLGAFDASITSPARTPHSPNFSLQVGQ